MISASGSGGPQTSLVVIQGTPFCNINCSYCYLAQRDDKSRITLPMIDKIVARLAEWNRFASEVTILWHSGEPLVLEPAFYAAAFDKLLTLQANGINISHALQTNATLVSEGHCRVLNEYQVSVGVSLDGPQDMHDAHRLTRAGTGTFAQTIKGIERLRAHGILPSAIAVLSKYAMRQPLRFYETFEQLGIPFVGLNTQEKEGVNRDSFFDDPEVSTALYQSFLREIFRLSLRRGTVLFRELVTFADLIRSGQFSVVSSEATLGTILSFTHDGRYGTYSPELLDVTHASFGAFAVGNVQDDSVEAVLSSLDRGTIGRHIQAGIIRCRSECDYFSICGGGSPANKLGEAGQLDITETAHCRFSKKLVLDVVMELLEDAALRRLAHRAIDTYTRHRLL
ncbi:GRRM system radical SAM/SPASM domain protein [Nitrosospira lacus]|uniref:GRRM system radical SAM/SPASM domain protein n=1 Tax=Nitrosospira lacus TaxID=1288494 RepID=A0A1W6SP27_9PROT|nr:cyclophane-forming radical SAM/SPASM peptide maturase GrrM/OscB [Nitrosospira lacus]ARO87553.1 GRRM system radical SAM/SPASM domain protein [Nitrosospira lacus]